MSQQSSAISLLSTPFNASQTLLAEVFDALPAHVAHIGPDGTIQNVNSRWRTFGASNGLRDPAACLGNSYIEICSGADGLGSAGAAEVAAGLDAVLRGKVKTYEFEYPCHSRKQERWYRLFASSFEIQAERHAILLHFDITDRKFAEFRTREQAELIDTVQDAVLVVSANDRIKYVNEAACRLYGWAKAEMMERKAHELLESAQSKDESKERNDSLFQNGFWSGELNHITKSGQAVTVGARWIVTKPESRGHVSILKVHTDLRVLSQLLRIQRMLTLGNSASGVVHDLNNILTPVVLLSDSIQRSNDPECRESAKRIGELAHRASGLTRQLLGFTRGFDGTRRVESAESLASELVSFAYIGSDPKIKFTSSLPDQSLKLECNRVQIHQILLNLFVNARDAIEDEGTIHLDVREQQIGVGTRSYLGDVNPGTYVVFRITDSGKGMTADELERAFEPFYTTKPIGKGTGLGLPTCLGIVKSHGGFIDLSSDPGNGTTASVYLPASRQQMIAASKNDPS